MMNYLKDKKILLLGGSGFVGKSIVKKLLELGSRVMVISRQQNKVKASKLSGEPGQLEIVSANIFEEGILENYINDKFAVINLCGILYESEPNEFEKIHTFLPNLIAEICKEKSISKFIHISALGASSYSKSLYSRTKALGEKKALENFVNCHVLRPSIIYGNGDNFFGQFAKMSNFSPILPLIGSNTMFQPVYVEDLALSVVKLLENHQINEKIYEIGGPKKYSFENLLEIMLKILERKRIFLRLNPKFMIIPGYFFSFLPRPPFTADQMKLLMYNNIVNPDMPGLKDLNVDPTSLEDVLPKILKFYKT